MDANPSEIYGALKEGAHVAGYTLERAVGHLTLLLKGDDWQHVGGGFVDVNAFLKSIKLPDEHLTIIKEHRKRIAKRIKELQPKASNRAVAKMLGVDESTVRSDVAGNPAPNRKKPNADNEVGNRSAGNPAPPTLGGPEAARAVERVEAKTPRGASAPLPSISGAEVAKLAARRETDLANTERRLAERVAFEQRRERGATVAELDAMIAAGEKFPVIYLDPPWEFETYSGKGKARSAERHYDVMSLDDIKAMPVAKLAADNCAIFMWCVWPEISGALEVLRAWGFEYKTAAFVWVKTSESAKGLALDGNGLHWGMGYWSRANTEACVLATKGKPERVDKDVHQVIIAPVGEHSAKPEEVRRRIEKLITGPYLELFGRKPVPGWTVWGNEMPAEAAE